MRLLVVGCAALLATAGPALAHYPMLEVEGGEPMQQVGKPFTITLAYGHPFLGDRLPARSARVKMRVAGAAAVTRTDDLKEGPLRLSLTTTPQRAGDHVFGWQLGVFQEGQRQVLDHAKIVIHVRGRTGSHQVGWEEALGHALEVLPLTRPYGVPVGSVFRGQVVRHVMQAGKEGEPPLEKQMVLAGGIVEAGTAPRLRGRDAYLANQRLSVKTDPRGVFAITLPRAGWWLISCATDGGPGQQGKTATTQRRAGFWVHVGRTVFDEPDPDPELGRKVEKARLTLELTGTLVEALRKIIEAVKIPFELEGLDAKAKVRLQAKDWPLTKVLDALCTQVRGAWKRRGGKILLYAP